MGFFTNRSMPRHLRLPPPICKPSKHPASRAVRQERVADQLSSWSEASQIPSHPFGGTAGRVLIASAYFTLAPGGFILMVSGTSSAVRFSLKAFSSSGPTRLVCSTSMIQN